MSRKEYVQTSVYKLGEKLTGTVLRLGAAILAIERDWRQVRAIEYRRIAGLRAFMIISFETQSSCEVNCLICCYEKLFRVLRTAVVIRIVSSIDPLPSFHFDDVNHLYCSFQKKLGKLWFAFF
jgi:hypothetical protein